MSFVGDLRTVVRGADFRKLFVVRLTSQFADGVLQIALASYVFFSPERQTSAPAAAAAFATLLLPYSIVGPFAGVMLDRWSRRQVLFWANSVRVAMVALVALLVAADISNLVFFASVLAALSINRFFLAGLSAALPHTVPRHELVMANSVSPTTGTLAFLIGGTSGYFLRAPLPEGAPDDVVVLLAAATVYAVAALLALRMGRHALGPDFDPDKPAVREAVRHVARGFVDGARHVRERPKALAALLAIGVHRMGYAIATISLILLSRNYFNDPADTDAGLGALGSALLVSGVGFATAAVITPLVTPRIGTRRWIVVLLAAAAVFQILPGGLFTQPTVLAAAFTLGVAAQGIKICVDTIVQEEVDDAFRGRVFSLYDVLFNGAFVVAALIAAVALPTTGKSYPIVISVALSYALAAIWYGRLSRTVRALPDGEPAERA